MSTPRRRSSSASHSIQSPLTPALPYGQGFVAGHGVGELLGSAQQTETHWVPLTTTVAVLVSVVPAPLSVPGAAPPSF